MAKEEKKKKTILEETLKKKIEELKALYEVGKSITSTLRLSKALNLITKKAAKIMGASCCSLRLLSPSKEELILKASSGVKLGSHKLKKTLRVGESIAGRVVKNGRARLINDISKVRSYKYPHLAVQKGLKALLTVPLIEKDKILGVLSIYSNKKGKYKKEDVRLLSMFASQAAIAITNARLYEQKETGYLNTIKTLADIIDAKDSHTYGHSERVMKHCIDIAKELGLSDKEKEILKYASLLHDIGKIGIDVGILRKPSKLTKEEWVIMYKHPLLGSGIVEHIGFLEDLAPIILCHHERYNGGGYPRRLKKKKIPLGARILSIVDAYESMISDRPYRKALSYKKARAELRCGAGNQFDPKIVRVFLRMLERKKRQ